MSINEMCRVAMISPASIFNILELRRLPAWLPPLCIMPHTDDPVDLQRRPNFDLCLVRDFPARIGNLCALSGLPVVLPSVEGTLNAAANHLYVRNRVSFRIWAKGEGGGAKRQYIIQWGGHSSLHMHRTWHVSSKGAPHPPWRNPV